MKVTIKYISSSHVLGCDYKEFEFSSKEDLIEFAKTNIKTDQIACAKIYRGAYDEIHMAEIDGKHIDNRIILYVLHCGVIYDAEADEWVVAPQYTYVEDAFPEGREFNFQNTDNYTILQINVEKYGLLGAIDEYKMADAVKFSDKIEISYEDGRYYCPAYLITFDPFEEYDNPADDDDPLIEPQNIAHITY